MFMICPRAKKPVEAWIQIGSIYAYQSIDEWNWNNNKNKNKKNMHICIASSKRLFVWGHDGHDEIAKFGMKHVMG